MIYLGADHAGFSLKEGIKKYLAELDYQYEDLGNTEQDNQDDYPDFALEVAQKVVATEQMGILICGTGIGMSMAANKVKGIRAALCCNEFMAQQSRQHNNANILCLGGRVHQLDQAKKIVKTWLETEFSKEERHIKRINKIKEAE